MNKTLGIYPGCSLNGTSREYYESVKALMTACGIEFSEIEDWNCCGATAAHSLNKELALALPIRNLMLAENQGFEDVFVPCAACFNRLVHSNKELKSNEELLETVKQVNGMGYEGRINILNIVQVLEKYVGDKLEDRIVKKINAKVACYYGCLLVRPHDLFKNERIEDPLFLDTLAKKSGAETIEWAFKTECCGAGLTMSRTESVARLSSSIISDAVSRGAEAIVVACPMCHSNLDMRRPEINKQLGRKVEIPVLYITQLIGLALGLDAKSLGLQRHFVKVPSTLINE